MNKQYLLIGAAIVIGYWAYNYYGIGLTNANNA